MILAFYALSLGYLARFHEAHRRLNQAAALSSYLPEREGALAAMILRIRRAELHVTEAEYIRGELYSGSKSCGRVPTDIDARRVTAKVDDAVISLEAAAHILQGRSHSSLWWGRYYALRFRVIAASGRLDERSDNLSVSFAFRRRHDYIAHLRGLFLQAELMCENDLYRLLRTIDYAYRAGKVIRDLNICESDCGEGIEGCDPLDEAISSAFCRAKWLFSRTEYVSRWCDDIRAYFKAVSDFAADPCPAGSKGNE